MHDIDNLFFNFNKLSKNYRFDKNEALALLRDVPIGYLMNMAHKMKCDRYPNNYVTYVIDTNPNYTNVCITKCNFCAFYRNWDDPNAYILSPEQIVSRVKYAQSLGATTVLLQGGHNPNVHLKDWLSYISLIRSECPNIDIHPFSPTEYSFMAKQEGVSVQEILKILWDYGIKTIPGGGAEILVDNVRKVIAPKKLTSEEWLKVSEYAHKIGFKTTATMMFGHVETDEEIVDHFLKLRNLQDKFNGFSSFIPWSFKPNNTILSQKVVSPVHPAKYIRIIAAARLILDNFPHIQSSWFSENVEIGQLGLFAGADDFGGILIEENVHKETGHIKSASVNDIVTMIERVGFIPAERDVNYNIRNRHN